MFIRYTDLGIGHSAMLRRIAQDTLGSHLVTTADTMDVINSEEGEDDSEECEGLEECEDEQEDDDDEGLEDSGDELSDSELAEEDGEEYGDEDDFDDACF
jgi:hypothetical protein